MAKKNSNQFMTYWGKQAHYTSVVHVGLGIGIGLLMQPYLAANNLASVVGWCLIGVSVLGHLYGLVA